MNKNVHRWLLHGCDETLENKRSIIRENMCRFEFTRKYFPVRIRNFDENKNYRHKTES